MMKDKIRFSDLSGWLKAAIILLWITIGIDLFFYLMAFMEGVITTIPLVS